MGIPPTSRVESGHLLRGMGQNSQPKGCMVITTCQWCEILPSMKTCGRSRVSSSWTWISWTTASTESSKRSKRAIWNGRRKMRSFKDTCEQKGLRMSRKREYLAVKGWCTSSWTWSRRAWYRWWQGRRLRGWAHSLRRVPAGGQRGHLDNHRCGAPVIWLAVVLGTRRPWSESSRVSSRMSSLTQSLTRRASSTSLLRSLPSLESPLWSKIR